MNSSPQSSQQLQQAATRSGGIETCTDAVRSRQLISQAVGIAMERFGLDSTRAFEYLVRVSQAGQVRLQVIAAELVARAGERDEGATTD